MKMVNIDARVAALAVALGSVGGGVIGYALARSRARREYAVRLDQAVAEVKQHYARPILPKSDKVDTVTLIPSRNRWASVIKTTLEPEKDKLEGIGDGSLDLEPAGENHGGNGEGTEATGAGVLSVLAADAEPVRAVEPDGPFQITEAAFGELNDEGFQTISVTFYAADKVLVDDHEQPIRDVIGTIGTANPLGYNVMSEDDDPQIRYVRNRRLEVDFEILLDARSYAETVLGYGRPDRRREARTGATAE